VIPKKKALSWMRFREKSPYCAGGILADEQVNSDLFVSSLPQYILVALQCRQLAAMI
jgi:hypothetical protein